MKSNNLGFVKVAACAPKLLKGNTEYNTNLILEAIATAEGEGAGIITFPSLALTGGGCGALYNQDTLYNGQLKGLKEIIDYTYNNSIAVIIGFYVRTLNTLIKCKAYISDGEVYVTSDTSITKEELQFFDRETEMFFDYNDFMENYFSSDTLLFDMENKISIGLAASSKGVLSFNSDNNINRIGQFDYLKDKAGIISSEQHCGLIHVSENGAIVIAENGQILASQSPFSNLGKVLFADVDYESINYNQLELNTVIHRTVDTEIPTIKTVTEETFTRQIRNNPFEPEDHMEMLKNCYEIFEIQSEALAKRLTVSHSNKSVLGISGGLDSTLALLVTINAHRIIGKPASDVVAVTMPGFGTTGTTYNNAVKMMKATGAEVREISIVDSVTQHFKDIGHDINNHNLTYENSQARERTQILMDIANMENGIVVGTGDLSEGALGWCTYNGDHMSMFGVNSAVPKTVIQLIVNWFIDYRLKEDKDFCSDNNLLAEALKGVLDTPISPELLPPTADGQIAQITEDNVGPYILHDFFIYHTVKNGTKPTKLKFLAIKAFQGTYDEEFIDKWIRVFYRRFFTQQFKRNCAPDSPAIGSIDLSHTKFVMPSDMDFNLWLSQLD
ncbi:MAG: NAD(+) synthase [Anaerovoracaceae bacterium]